MNGRRLLDQRKKGEETKNTDTALMISRVITGKKRVDLYGYWIKIRTKVCKLYGDIFLDHYKESLIFEVEFSREMNFLIL